jgi:hypothetical protein
MSNSTAAPASIKKVNGMTLLDFSKMEGVGDLPMRVRAAFGRALMAEAEAGYTTEEAYKHLEDAVAAETSLASA